MNGKPQGRIFATRSIRQGDPLSHILFVLAMDYLSRITDEAYAKGLIEGFSLHNEDFHVSHLLFADDILLFSTPNEVKLQNLKLLLNSFELASGLI